MELTSWRKWLDRDHAQTNPELIATNPSVHGPTFEIQQLKITVPPSCFVPVLTLNPII